MKTGTKKILLAAAALAVLGLGLCLTALALSDFDITRLSAPSGRDREELAFSCDAGGIDRVIIDTAVDSVTLQPSPDGQIHLHCFTGNDFTYSTDTDRSELLIKQNNTGIKHLPNWFQVNFDWLGGRENLTLSVPAGYSGDLLLELDAGSVTIAEGVEIAGALDVKQDLGGFSAERLTARSITVESGAGNVDGKDWQIAQYAFLSTGSGSVSLYDSAVGSMLSCTTGSGNVSLARVSAQETAFTTNAGSIEFQELTAGNIRASSGLGDIEGSIHGEEADYSIDARTDLGDCSLPVRKGLTSKTLRLSCGAGDIRVRFLP